MENTLVDALLSFDLNRYEAKVYETLLKLGESSAWKISLNSGVPQSKIYEVLNSLEKKGFVEKSAGRPLKFRAVDPELALKNYIENFKKSVESRINILESLYTTIKQTYLSRKNNEDISIIWTLKGRDKVYAKALELINSAEHECYIAGHRPLKALNCIDSLGNIALNKNIKIKVLGNFSQFCKDFMDSAGIEYREMESFYEYLIIVDEREMLMVISQEDGELFGIDVKAKECILANKNHFELLWRQAMNKEITK